MRANGGSAGGQNLDLGWKRPACARGRLYGPMCARGRLYGLGLVAEPLGLLLPPQNYSREHLPYLLDGAFLGLVRIVGVNGL